MFFRKHKVACLVVVIGLFLLLGGIFFGKIFSKQRKESVSETIIKESLQELEDKKGSYEEHQIVLTGMKESAIKKLAEDMGADYRVAEVGDFGVLYLNDTTSIRDIYENEKYQKYLSQMQPDYYGTLCAAPESSDEEEPGVVVASTDTCDSFSYVSRMLNFDNTWETSRGSGAKIAVLDTGVDVTNPYLKNKISDKSFNASEGKRVSDFDLSVVDEGDKKTFHGTQVASVISAEYDEELGTGGLAPDAELIIIKLELNNEGKFTASDFVFGIAYAIECDVDIINMSFTLENISFESYTKLAADSDIICIAAAGNDSTATSCWPASDENVIGVGAVHSEDSYADSGTDYALATFSLPTEEETQHNSYVLDTYSNYGENLELVAPNKVRVAVPMSGIETSVFRGTSCSSAMVSAAAAIYMSQNTHQELKDMKDVLCASCTDIGIPGIDWYYGEGLLDVHALVVEPKGFITYDPLTDELKNDSHIFVRGHVLQYSPEPERSYGIFDGWNYDINCVQEYDNVSDILYDDLTVYASWANEDDTEPFNYYIKEDGTAEVTGYLGKRRYITIPDTLGGVPVTSIGTRAFAGNNRARKIELPSTLETIGEYAFYNCTKLVEVDIPQKVSVIREYAFACSPRLGRIGFVENGDLTKIGSYAFAQCGSLVEIYLPEKLSEIDGSVFLCDGNLLHINVNNKNKVLSADGKGLYKTDNDNKEFVYFAGGLAGSYSIEEGTTAIGKIAFAYSKIQHLTLPDSLKMIGSESFPYSNIKELIIPNQVSEIGSGSFYKCSDLTAVTLGENITELPDLCFYMCKKLSEITCVENISLKTLKTACFGECGALQDIDFIDGVSVIGTDAFCGCGSVKSIVLPSSLNTLGESAFKGCSQLESLVFEDGISLTILEGWSFAGCPNLKRIHLPEGLKEIGTGVFLTSGLEEISIPATVEKIGYGAFGDCQNLSVLNIVDGNVKYQSVDNVIFEKDKDTSTFSILHTYPAGLTGNYDIPDTVTKIADYAFLNQNNIEEVGFGNISEIGESAFANCHGIKNLHFNNQLKLIGNGAFNSNVNLQTVSCGTGLSVIGEAAFSECYSLKQVDLNEGLLEIKNNAFFYDGITSLVLPTTLQQLGSYALGYCNDLTSINIPEGLVNIGSYAFSKDTNLKNVTFSENCKLSRLNYGTFEGTGIESIVIPKSVSTMGQRVFDGCESLQQVEFSQNSNLEALAAWTFNGTQGLRKILFHEGSALRIIEARALEYLTSLNELNIVNCENLKTIDNYALQYCSSISQIQLPDHITDIGRYAFFCCNGLNKLVMPMEIDFIGRYAFAGNSNIEIYFNSAVLPANLQEYWDYGIKGYYLGNGETFENTEWEYSILNDNTCVLLKYLGNESSVTIEAVDGHSVSALNADVFNGTSVETVTLPESVVSLGTYTFRGADSLKTINLPASLERIGSHAFDGSSVQNVNFPEDSSLNRIDSYAFRNAKNLSEIEIPAAVTVIDQYAFFESGISSLTFRNGSLCSEIGRYAFAHTDLSEIQLPDALKKVNYHAFEGDTLLKSITFGTGTVQLYGYAFYNTGINTVYIPENVEYIGEYCFATCPELTRFEVSTDNAYYSSEDDVLFNKNKTRLMQYPAARNGSYRIPDNTEVLAFGAFEGSAVSEITTSSDSRLTTIGYRAFYNCDQMMRIDIPQSVRSIDYYAFAYCKKLNQLNIASDCCLNGIYEGAFYGCEALSRIDIPATVMEIGEYAFYGCVGLQEVTFESNCQIRSIQDCAFQYAGLYNITLPDLVMELGDYAFANCKIIDFSIGENISALGDSVLYGNTSLEHLSIERISKMGIVLEDLFGKGNIPTSLSVITLVDAYTIPDSAFENANSVIKIESDSDINYIGDSSFRNCSNLQSIPSCKPSYIGEMAFEGCYVLNGLIDISELKTIENSAFYECYSLSSITGFENVEYFGENCFSRCFTKCAEPFNIMLNSVTEIRDGSFRDSAFKNVFIGKHVESIGENAFANCSKIESLVIEDHIDNNEYVIAEHAFSAYCITSVTLGEGLTQIGRYSFSLIKAKEIYLPDTLVEIPDYAFWSCNNIRKLKFGNSLKTIGNYAFVNAYDLKVISFPESIESIGQNAFYCESYIGKPDWKSLLKPYIWIPKNIKEIGVNAFNNAELYFEGSIDPQIIINNWIDGSDVQVNYDENKVEYLYDFAYISTDQGIKLLDYYGDASSLEIDAIEGVPVYEIGVRCFDNAPNLSSIKIGDSVLKIDDYAFQGLDLLDEVVMGDGIEEIGTSAFQHCQKCYNVTFGNGLKVVKDFAFCESGIVNAVLPATTKTVGNYAFKNCNLVKLSINNGIEYIGDYAFEGVSFTKYVYNEDEIIIPESVTYLGVGCFSGIRGNWGNVIVNASVEKLPNKFMYASWGGHVSVQGTIKEIGDQAFCSNYEISHSYGINSIDLSDDIEIIGWQAFYSNRNLKELVLPSKLKRIESGAFYDCKTFSFLVIPESVEYLGTSFNNNRLTIAFRATELPTNLSEGWDDDIKGYVLGYKGDGYDDDLHVKYRIYSDGIHIVRYDGHGTDIVLDTIQGEPIVSIDEFAFSLDQGRDVYGNAELETIHLGSGIKKIERYAFYGCESLRSVEFDDNSSLESIGMNAFGRCIRLSEFAFPESLKIIASEAFAITNLEEVKLSKNIEEIGSYAFYNSNIKDVFINEDAPLTTIAYCTFSQNNVENVVLPHSITAIESEAFNSASLRSINLSSFNLEKVGSKAFIDSPICDHDQGLIYLEHILIGYDSEVANSVQMREGTTLIQDRALTDISGVDSFTIAKSVRELPYACFARSTIKKLVIPNEVKLLDGSISDMNYLEVLSIAKVGVEGYILMDLFGQPYAHTWSCPLDTIIVTGDNDKAVLNSTQVKKLQFKGSVKDVSIICPNLEIIEFPDELETITYFTAPSSETVKLPEGLKNLIRITGDMKKLYIPESVETIGVGAVSDCPNIELITLPFANISGISNNGYLKAVLGDTHDKLKCVEICGSPKEVPASAFVGCQFEELVLPDSIEVIRELSINVGLKKFNMPKNLKEIDFRAFRGLKVKSLSIPESVTVLQDGWLEWCDQIEEITFNCKNLSEGALGSLADCTNLRRLTIPFMGSQKDTYASLRQSFSLNTEKLESVTLLDSCSVIKDDAFDGITGIDIYCYSEENAVEWPEGWNNGNTVHYIGTWSQIDFLSGGEIISTSIQKVGDPIHLPAKVQRDLKDTSNYSYVFAGWDITNDGVADRLLSANVRNYIQANAVYDKISKNNVAYINASSPETEESDTLVFNAFSGRDDLKKAVINIDASALSETVEGDVSFISDLSEVSFNNYAVNQLSTNNGTISIGTSVVTPDLVEGTIQGEVLYDFSVTSDVSNVSFSDGNGGIATVSVPYKLDDTAVPVVTNIAEDGSVTNISASYDEETGQVVFETNHFSIYKFGSVLSDEICTLSFDVDGGTAIAALERPKGRIITLPEAEKTNFDFYRWEDEEGNTYEAGQKYKITKDSTLKAKWIVKTDIAESANEVSLSQTRYQYDGTEHKPEVTIAGLRYGEDYKISYENNVEVGQASVIIKGNGLYKGQIIVPFEIYCEHDWNAGEITKESTCAEEGSISYNCNICGNSKTESIPALGHIWDEGAIVQGATCTEAGEMIYTCSRCEETRTETIPAAGHAWDEEFTIDRDATCTEPGSKSIHCANCDEVKDLDEIPATGHQFGEWITIESSSCEGSGSEQRVCEVCGYIETRGMDPTGHSWNTDYTVDREATCTEDGSRSIHCLNCDAVKDNEVIPAYGHDWDGGTIIKEATCTEAGEMHYNCNRCSEEKEETIPAAGHAWDEEYTVDREATCTEAGSRSIHCVNCNETKETEEIPATGHNFGEWETITFSSCEYSGSQRRVCEVCGFTENRALNPLGHSWEEDYTVDKEPTCTEDGSKSIHCTKCDAVKDSEIIPALDHAWDAGITQKAPTCTESGEMLFTCSRCEETKTEVISANGHAWEKDYTVDREATCTEAGSRSIHCANCDAVKDTEEIAALDHAWDEGTVTKAATCTEAGKIKHTCSRCEETRTETIPATGHAWDSDYTVDKEATCTEAGSRSIHCANCDEVKDVEEIPATGHAWEADYTVDKTETCTESGSKSIHCVNCDEKKDVEEIPAHGHQFGEWIIIDSATCASDGCQQRVCEVCGYTETDNISASGHTWEDHYTIDKAATCTEDGSQSIHCANCDAVKDSEVIPSEGHRFGAWETIEAGSCEVGGSQRHTCTVCGLIETRNLDPAGHAWETEYTVDRAATCTQDGSQSIHCANCDAVKDSVVIPTLGHAWNGGTISSAPTCTAAGQMIYTCDRCGITRTEEIEAAGHAWDTEYTIDQHATCTEGGIRSIHCANCEERTNIEEIPAAGHQFGEWVTIESPDCDSAGSAQRTCAICGFTETNGIDPTGHTWETEYTVDIEPTCTTNGSQSIHCVNCDAKQNSEVIPALGHVWNEGIVSKASTCTENGEMLYNCTRCGETDTEVIPAAGHQYGAWVPQDEELHVRVCSADANHTEAATHHWDAGVVTKELTLQENGESTYTCADCGMQIVREILPTAEDIIRWINELPTTVGLMDKETVEVVRNAYDRMSQSQKALVTTDALSKLETAEAQVAEAESAEEKEEADRLAANTVIERINGLPETITADSDEIVKAVRNAYNSLTEEQKHLIDAAVLSKLTNAEQKVTKAKQEAESAKTISIAGATVTGIVNKTYTGKALTQDIAVKVNKTTLKPNTDYTVSFKNNINAGKATITITGKGKYNGTLTKTFIINKAVNPLSVKTKTTKVKYAKLSKKKQTIAAKKAFIVVGAQGNVTYKVAKYDKKAKKKIKVSQTGKITIKKGLKKGTYKLKVKVTAAGNHNYLAGTKTVTLKVKVK